MFSWGLDISRLHCLVLDVAVRRGGCASCFPRCGEGRVEMVLVVLVWGVEEGGVAGLSVATLSSSA